MGKSNADKIISFRVTPEQKGKYLRKADEDKRSLSNWIMVQLDKAAEEASPDAPPSV